jgi:hypothetical protein
VQVLDAVNVLERWLTGMQANQVHSVHSAQAYAQVQKVQEVLAQTQAQAQQAQRAHNQVQAVAQRAQYLQSQPLVLPWAAPPRKGVPGALSQQGMPSSAFMQQAQQAGRSTYRPQFGASGTAPAPHIPPYAHQTIAMQRGKCAGVWAVRCVFAF